MNPWITWLLTNETINWLALTFTGRCQSLAVAHWLGGWWGLGWEPAGGKLQKHIKMIKLRLFLCFWTWGHNLNMNKSFSFLRPYRNPAHRNPLGPWESPRLSNATNQEDLAVWNGGPHQGYQRAGSTPAAPKYGTLTWQGTKSLQGANVFAYKAEPTAALTPKNKWCSS